MYTLPEIIGIAGTNGSGKDTLAEIRHERNGARIASLSDILRIEATKRGLSHERENLRDISAEWGRKMGAGALSVMTLEHYFATKADTDTGLSIVSVRRAGEAATIQERGGVVLWVDAPAEVRYGRIALRARSDDMISFEEFCAQEAAELTPDSDDPFIVNMSAVRDIADLHLDNTFNSKEAYARHLAEMFDL